jgi:hypothetical protein
MTFTQLKIAPTGTRLHEWIALERGYLQAPGIEPIVRWDIVSGIMSSWQGKAYKARAARASGHEQRTQCGREQGRVQREVVVRSVGQAAESAYARNLSTSFALGRPWPKTSATYNVGAVWSSGDLPTRITSDRMRLG